MLFHSIEFFVFLPIVFLLYWRVLRTSRRGQNVLIVVASYVFYAWWDYRFLLLIAALTALSYAAGRLLLRYDERPAVRRWICGGNIVAALSALVYFKYCNFFGESFAALLHPFGIEATWTTLNIVLPVGISFYTFQALSYTIDVYRRRIDATDDIISFFAFVAFFPQLMAGPIERAANILPQFAANRAFRYSEAADGMRQMLWGMFKKVVVADNCATIVDAIWATHTAASGFSLFMGAALYSLQLYADFSGYSDIAIGTARLFGIRLMANFRFPLFSRDQAEFWRRWHASLNTWFRDYIYIPLGGSRGPRWLTARNVAIVFLISGLWHGARINFLVWGAYHAILFLPLVITGRNRLHRGPVAEGRLLPSPGEAARIIATFLLFTAGLVIFRAHSLPQAVAYFGGIFSPTILDVELARYLKALPFALIMLAAEWLQRDKEHALQVPISGKGPMNVTAIRWTVYIVVALMTLVFAVEEAEYVYFQF